MRMFFDMRQQSPCALYVQTWSFVLSGLSRSVRCLAVVSHSLLHCSMVPVHRPDRCVRRVLGP